jgi:dihydrofolate reductase
MGGARIIDQCLPKALVEELHLHIAPGLLGAGIALFDLARPPGLAGVAGHP